MTNVTTRRLFVLAVAAGASAPALAQTAATATAPRAAPAMGKAEMDHATNTAMAGGASLMMADIALEKAHAAKVKEFAKFEHDEQTTIAEILKAMDPSMQPPAPDAKTAQTIEKLKGLSGAAFDRAFVAGQIDGHEKLLAIQDAYLQSGNDRETTGVTKLAKGMIKEHLALLADLHKAVG